jgi:DNA-binding CsgD family transcriptional regulator
MDADRRREILGRYLVHRRQFDNAAESALADVIPFLRPHDQSTPRLSPRERRILQLIADGLTNSEIAVQLIIAEETVKSHVRRLLAKLQARSRAHAVALGLRHKLIS